MGSIEVHYTDGGDWAGLYVDGKLSTIGDSYLAVDKVFQILGVKTVDDEAFLRGGNGRTGYAQTLEEVEAYRKERDERLETAAALRRKAQSLLDEAKELEETK